MSDRAEYIKGLRRLADLLEAQPGVRPPWDGTTGALSFYLQNQDGIGQALHLISAMDAPAVRLENSNVLWCKISGGMAGLRVVVNLQADRLCEKRVHAVYTDSQGDLQEVAEWVIPKALLDAVAERNAAQPSEGDQAEVSAR